MTTSEQLLAKKQNNLKIAALTCYDYPTAVLEEQAGVDVIFVGDSVGTNILGYDNETQVTLDDIIHHLKAVRRGARQSYILGDLPYACYDTPEQALDNAQRLVAAGADIVKLEGDRPTIVSHLVAHGIEVCGHIGLQPQTHQQKAVQGKSFAQAKELLEQALDLEQAGIKLLVLELVPEEVGKLITEAVTVPTIGIGAGRYTDGQVLIVNDILGITPRKLRLAKRYADYQTSTLAVMNQYKLEVEEQVFPSEDNVRHMAPEELQQLLDWVKHRE
ncbi:3-methyl-2-oxobutanoate hydroxymethyltransferase [Oculatella sp. LEGE 06141]|uniref:3-methyl-2-oxobutanoate hydroxymethyltransferase n=1 Tax=Oculatella sp. LEGE 06141 TaxID=1828648 RepID=UPI00188201DE|nr:3-methyl-2-oxobutanoate hydroxymethyltransferase [Oculatella sp. LEGE 06141]MBE9178170.1 3-methyl-2-oxobutanoate hydroxymethyltransferase [Oculatella sp. LEGE 06141]